MQRKFSTTPVSRRWFHKAAAMTMGSLLSPRLLAAEDKQNQKYLFIFVNGGWDPTFVFAPLYGSPNIDMDGSGTLAEVNGISFTDSGQRPSVRSFFERYGQKTCVINGMEVRSVTHERCRRLLMTGQSQGTSDDWAARMAAAATGYELPYLVVSGPAYTADLSSVVVRAGETGQLTGLLDGTALAAAEPARTAPFADVESAMDSFLQSRLDAYLASAGTGRDQQFALDFADSQDRVALLKSLDTPLDLRVSTGIVTAATRAKPALECFEQGFSRCAMVDHSGQFDIGWDSHSNLGIQSVNYELLFADLLTLLTDMESRPGPSGGKLSDEVTLVVISEMGRAPKMNTNGGKDHWTFTSAMLIGPTVRGGRVLGAYDDTLMGRPMDLISGEASDQGTLITTQNLGATLLAMNDLDPAEATEAAPIEAVYQ